MARAMVAFLASLLGLSVAGCIMLLLVPVSGCGHFGSKAAGPWRRSRPVLFSEMKQRGRQARRISCALLAATGAPNRKTFPAELVSLPSFKLFECHSRVFDRERWMRPRRGSYWSGLAQRR